jgi:hypothetical protein
MKQMILAIGDTFDSERDEWLRFSGQRLAEAYGEDEPEYTLDMIQEPNPAYLRTDP